MKRSAAPQRKSGLKRSQGLKKGRGFSASPAQRAKVKDMPCIATGFDSHEAIVDPAHLTARAQGGCDDPLCVVPLVRVVHDSFDRRGFDLLPHLIADKRVAEMCHALEHYEGNLIGLLERLTGERWVPASEAER